MARACKEHKGRGGGRVADWRETSGTLPVAKFVVNETTV
jgi:hypothetical protein